MWRRNIVHNVNNASDGDINDVDEKVEVAGDENRRSDPSSANFEVTGDQDDITLTDAQV